MAVSSFLAGCKSAQYLVHAASVLKHQNNEIRPPMGFEAVVCTLVYERDEFQGSQLPFSTLQGPLDVSEFRRIIFSTIIASKVEATQKMNNPAS